MDSDWAAEHLQVIRTLMERTAIYRRALAPVMLCTGAVGLAAALIGWAAGVQSPRGFIVYWLAVCAVPLVGSLLLVRRQALRAAEPFWSPPTRRVALATLPSLVAGLILSLAIWGFVGRDTGTATGRAVATELLPPAWVVLYGCAAHAAGFFMPRGIKLFGWLFVVGGCGVFAAGALGWSAILAGHLVMGLFFGVLHLAYGVYLLFTEPRTMAA